MTHKGATLNLAEIKRQALMGSQYVAANVVTNGELVELIDVAEQMHAWIVEHTDGFTAPAEMLKRFGTLR
jgi:hypothetical protein